MLTHLNNISFVSYTPESGSGDNLGFVYIISKTEDDMNETIKILNDIHDKELSLHVTVTGEKIMLDIYESGKKIVTTGFAGCNRPDMFKYKSEKRYKSGALLGVGSGIGTKISIANEEIFQPLEYTLEAMEVM